jgi:hypothetical protein
MFDYSKLSPNQIEVLPLSVDIPRLRDQFEKEILPLPPVVRSKAVAGWSVQSFDGDYQKGLELGFLPNNGPGNRGPTWLPKSLAEAKLLTMQDYVKPTSICTGYLFDLLQRIDAMGFNPRRARILRLGPRSESSWHVDGQPNVYSVRLHIPIVTNPKCFFNYVDESVHMAADGNAFLVKVNQLHMIQNRSDEDRYHFVVNIWDQFGETRFHRYNPSN